MRASTLFSALSVEMSRQVYKEIGEKHFVDNNDIKFILDNGIEAEFQYCLTVAIKAFVAFWRKDIERNSLKMSALIEYFKSPLVSEEISHLLDPGSEYFDRGKLTQDFCTKFSEHFENLEPQLIFDAWEEFLKAFYFASRSATHLREFLRASYETGNFRALSNIENVLQKMELAVSEIQVQELSARQSMTDYMGELKMYKHWATTFSNELRNEEVDR